MRLTWFGGTTLRLYVGGRIVVADAQRAHLGIDPVELISAADLVFALINDAGLPALDPAAWRPRRPARAVDDDGSVPEVLAFRIGEGDALIEGVGEPPVALLTGDAPRFGRWADGAVIVLMGEADMLMGVGSALLDVARPRLIALAGSVEATEAAVAALRERLGGVGLISLEPGLAVEV